MLATLNDVLPAARDGHYAVGLFNTIDTDMLQAVIEAAEAQRSPVIIGTAEILLPYGELKLIAPSLLEAARRATVPVVLHYDHGLTFDRCMEALRLGFSSVMFDASAHPYAENTARTREMVKIAHALGASVEGEVGHVGSADVSDPAGEDHYTTPENARSFLADTGVDALAVAIGTAHGTYRVAPKLSFDRLAQIRRAVDVPLVLHGGSGLSDQDFTRSVAGGIAKINIFTDLCKAGVASMADTTPSGTDYLLVRNRKVAAIREAVEKKMQLFGSCGKA